MLLKPIGKDEGFSYQVSADHHADTIREVPPSSYTCNLPAHGDRTVGDVVRRFRCQVCGAGAITVVLSETFERRRVPLVGPECGY